MTEQIDSDECPNCNIPYYRKLDGFTYCPECLGVKKPKKKKPTLKQIATWLWDPYGRKQEKRRENEK